MQLLCLLCPRNLLVSNILQHVTGHCRPSRAPETASPNRCRQRPWYARPVARSLGSSNRRGWNSPGESTYDIEFQLEGLGRLEEMPVSVSLVDFSSFGDLRGNCLPERLPSETLSNSLCRGTALAERMQIWPKLFNSRWVTLSTGPRDL